MSTIHLKQSHSAGLKKARAIASEWATEAQEKLAMTCDYEEGELFDCIHFKRAGVTGQLWVRANEFEIKAELGFLLTALKSRIEQEILQNLQAKLANA